MNSGIVSASTSVSMLPEWLGPVMWAIGILLPAIGILSIVLFNMLVNRLNRFENHVNQRLQTLGHEDRETRQQINGVYHLMLEIQKDCNKSNTK